MNFDTFFLRSIARVVITTICFFLVGAFCGSLAPAASVGVYFYSGGVLGGLLGLWVTFYNGVM